MNILKLLHVLFIFIWLGSLLTLTRLMAYLPKETPEVQGRLGRICKRMYFFVDLPSMVLAVLFGIAVIFIKGVDMKAGWLHMKWTFALLLIICDVITGRQIAKIGKIPIKGRGIFYKILHALIALFLIGALAAIYIVKQRHL